MTKNNWRGSYEDNKYGSNDKTWLNRNDDGTVKQYNVKDLDNGDHFFVNTQTGVQGAALSNYRPNRDK